MRVLVTGGAGYVGSISVEALVDAGHDVVVLDDLSTGHRAAVHPGARLVAGSYADEAATTRLLRESARDAILHCGARSIVPESIREPARYFRDNVAGGIALLEAARAAGVERVVFSSSAAVYGVPAATPIGEDAPLHPINPYGETKRAFEAALGAYAAAYGLGAVSLRYFNVAGASQRNGEVHDPETHLIPNVLAAAAGIGPPLTVHGDDYPTPDGTCVRDYIDVRDLAAAHLLALAAAGASLTGPELLVCNLGSGGGFSVREVLAATERVIGRPVPHAVGPRRAGDPPVLVASAARATEVLGWRPAFTALEPMIEAAWRWRQDHPGGYDR